MYSNIIPFENVVDAISDELGIANLTNQYPKLRRLTYRVEKDIGFGRSLLMKRIVYSKEDGTIVNKRARLPEDLIFIEQVGTCFEGLCPHSYKLQGNFIFLCDDLDKFSLVYYTMLCDGEGNPAVPESHLDAITAGITYYMYKPKVFNKEGTVQLLNYYKQEYFDRIGEAIGNEIMPTTQQEWEEIAAKLRMSYRDMLIYDNRLGCFTCIEESPNNEKLIDGNTADDMVYYWQYNDLATNISVAPTIDQSFLDLQETEPIETFLNGMVVPYTNIGRIAFAIANVPEDYYQIVDVFQTDITSVVFDTYYNAELKTQIYISKEYYTHGNIYYQLIKN